MKAVSTRALDGLEQLLAGANSVPIAGGEVQCVWAALPGRTAVAVAQVDGVLWIFIDDEKPLGRAHAAELIADQLGCEQDVTGLRRIPTATSGCQQPCHLQLVS